MVALRRARRGLVLLVGISLVLLAAAITIGWLLLDWTMGRLP